MTRHICKSSSLTCYVAAVACKYLAKKRKSKKYYLSWCRVSSLVFNERYAQQTKQQTKQNTKTTNDKKPLVSSSSSSTLNSYVANNNFHTAVWLAACLKSTSMSRDSATAEKSSERERERERVLQQMKWKEQTV